MSELKDILESVQRLVEVVKEDARHLSEEAESRLKDVENEWCAFRFLFRTSGGTLLPSSDAPIDMFYSGELLSDAAKAHLAARRIPPNTIETLMNKAINHKVVEFNTIENILKEECYVYYLMYGKRNHNTNQNTWNIRTSRYRFTKRGAEPNAAEPVNQTTPSNYLLKNDEEQNSNPVEH